MVCVPCGYNKYKEAPGAHACTSCPGKTHAASVTNTGVEQCNRCPPGYYETNDPTYPCEVCSPNHICVGSDPMDPDLMMYSGKRVKCDKNAVTLVPYEENIYLTNCLCDKGYMARTRTGVVKCEAVPKNTYKDVIGNVGPTDCPPGSYTLKTGATDASECVCKKGMFFDKANKRCTICPEGMYCLGGRLPNGEHMSPMMCTDGNAVTKDGGATSPSECLCKPGFYLRQDGRGGCVECPENTYKTFISNESCTQCPKNSVTYGQVGATSKEQCVCAPGYYFTGTCKVCGYPDKYCPGGIFKHRDDVTGKDIYETSAPIDCPPHTEIPPGVDAADSYDNCKCSKGYAFARRDEQSKTKICVPCPPGSYKGSVMDSSCNGLCTQNATSLPGAFSPSQCFCQRGYYYLAGGICAPCVEGARCDGGLLDSGGPSYKRSVVRYNDHVKPVPIEGYYLDKINLELRKPDDWRFIECPIKGACLGEKGCSESMTAYLCAECRTGFTNNFKKGALCSKCPSTWSNVLLTVAWYLALLLVNIVMACLNVSAGFNRRSIHSVVIKIALNYGVCMSVLNVINFSDLALPEELKSTTIQWIKLLYRETKTYHTSIDCLLQQWFGMKHADAFFYNMLFIACLPVILLFIVTVLMWVILGLFKLTRGSTMRSKLALLYQSKVQGMNYLYDRLAEEYSNERLFMIFRYIPLPGETRWVRFKHFLEDMIPIYVTVLFSLHGNTTSQMLSLLDCTHISLGQSIPSKYVLRPAMSIKCSLDPDEGYIPYLLLGLGGLIFWGFGIPLFSYIVLLMNRRNLYAPDVRMKYGFLHNGYQQGYWFWEAIVFTRKSLVLVIGSIVIVPSQNTSGSRIWMALAVAVFFLIIQLIYKPFDERDYFVLGRLESHSMISWTASLLAVYLMCYIRLQPTVVTIVCAFLFLNSCYFFFVVITSSARALLTTMRHKRDKTLFRKLRWIVDVLLYFEARRSSREPQIHYNQRIGQLQLKSSTKRRKWLGIKTYKLTSLERYYFVNIVTEIYRIVICHLKLDVMPKLLIEFLIRLSISFTRLEEKMSKKELFQDLKDGDLSTLVAWAAEKESRKPNRILKWDSLEGGVNIPDMLLNDKNLTAEMGLRREELQDIMDCLFDDNVLEGNTKLPDFYHSITRIWIMDTNMLTFLFSVYKHVKYQRDKERLDEMNKSNAKLRAMMNNLQALAEGEKDLEEFANAENVAQLEEELKTKSAKRDQLLEELKEMQSSPDTYCPGDTGSNEPALDAAMKDLGFTVKGALEKYVIDALSSSESDTDDETESDSEGETTSDSDYSTDEE
ncbi:kringle domain-containing protein [Babesia ovata]|uniref:Kringle domain-containing protein n=1 Tax=Babesia ovata TaxID=189622 RepID=A0A2H6KHW0_9APIC|nr:kringle domain-containing protein [Babesia ovata]GBE62575.1 kringle domain-containing protein [Babesia ovata]